MTTQIALAPDLKCWHQLRPTDRLFARLGEGLALLTILVMLADIPKIGYFPISPRFFLLPSALFLISMFTPFHLRTAFREIPPAIVAFLGLVLLAGAFQASPRPLVIFWEGLATFALIFGLATGSSGKALRLTRVLTLFYVVSGSWMILSTFIPEPFANIRGFLYAGHLDRFTGSNLIMAYPTGLTFGHFAMGYQLSVGLVLALLLIQTDKGLWRLVWLSGSLILMAAVILSGQRSILPALGVALGLFLLHRRRIRIALLVMGIAGLGLWFFHQMEISKTPLTMMFQKLEHDDYRSRISWQLAALRIIVERPMGDLFGELNWDQEALDHGADFDVYGGTIKAVHNAYLGNALQYGWIGAALVLWAIWHILNQCLGRVLNPTYFRCPSQPYALLCVLALIAVMVQALFHNADLFTLEPSSWVIFSLAGAWVWLLRREKRAGW